MNDIQKSILEKLFEEGSVELKGVIKEIRKTHYIIECENFPYPLQSTIAGKMRKHRIRVTLGDHVKVKISKYDLKKGIITFREKNKPTS